MCRFLYELNVVRVQMRLPMKFTLVKGTDNFQLHVAKINDENIDRKVEDMK